MFIGIRIPESRMSIQDRGNPTEKSCRSKQRRKTERRGLRSSRLRARKFAWRVTQPTDFGDKLDFGYKLRGYGFPQPQFTPCYYDSVRKPLRRLRSEHKFGSISCERAARANMTLGNSPSFGRNRVDESATRGGGRGRRRWWDSRNLRTVKVGLIINSCELHDVQSL
jgi:hypothetical protein